MKILKYKVLQIWDFIKYITSMSTYKLEAKVNANPNGILQGAVLE